ncbi:454_t:CDS:2 [Scutellospora calospora]|uniref:454_t:CDS:1 n=1 Tax=Scutellospora calospora TaxID=85575 RepID=A0ACA9KJ91_9GLOM|nr:454_t:CDS:2 [Scutellospora calospora]
MKFVSIIAVITLLASIVVAEPHDEKRDAEPYYKRHDEKRDAEPDYYKRQFYKRQSADTVDYGKRDAEPYYYYYKRD